MPYSAGMSQVQSDAPQDEGDDPQSPTAYALLASTYGLPADSLSSLLPSFTKASIGTPAFALGVVLGSLDTCDKLLPSGLRGRLFSALSADFSDGVFDGKVAVSAITVGSGTSLSSTAGTSDFLSCVEIGRAHV